MNRTISEIGSTVVTITVFLFMVCLVADFLFGSYLVCTFLPLGYIMMALSTFRSSGISSLWEVLKSERIDLEKNLYLERKP
ncbi:MAG: hypothetical protein PUG60_00245 [Lachnospiraceae bacterium]|nr:hypothetical protein [Lachnospiraceae bacterium]MDY4970946.1 hypothetical protein [Lachnospiraceae bacterium]